MTQRKREKEQRIIENKERKKRREQLKKEEAEFEVANPNIEVEAVIDPAAQTYQREPEESQMPLQQTVRDEKLLAINIQISPLKKKFVPIKVGKAESIQAKALQVLNTFYGNEHIVSEEDRDFVSQQIAIKRAEAINKQEYDLKKKRQ